jgi:quercetin dioxygenase-like cupin family protein
MLKDLKIEKIEPVFEDKRGKIIDILDDEEILHVGIITSNKGAVRGNHFHNIAKQYNYILKGVMELTVKESINSKDQPETHILEKGHFVYIPPKVIHSLKALEDSVFLDLNTVSRSGDGYEDDTIRC